MKVPFFDSRRVLASKKGELLEAFERVLDSGHLVLGPEVEAFEREFGAYLGVPADRVVSCNSGTDALTLALKAWGIGPGDEVLVPTLTALPTATAVLQAGAQPVFVDIDPDTFLMSFASVKAALSPRVRAVIPVHLYGNGVDIPALRQVVGPGVRVLEDVAQAAGTRLNGKLLGTFGHAAAFSFYPTKNLGALGDGGLVVFETAGEAEIARSLRYYGQGTRYELARLDGWNTRLDELQAAFLRTGLRHLEAENGKRRELHSQYGKQLAGLPGKFPRANDTVEPAWHLAVWCTPERDRLRAFLQESGVSALIHYPIPCHLQAPYREFRRVSCENSEVACRSILSLPLFSAMTGNEVAHVTSLVRRFFGQ